MSISTQARMRGVCLASIALYVLVAILLDEWFTLSTAVSAFGAGYFYRGVRR